MIKSQATQAGKSDSLKLKLEECILFLRHKLHRITHYEYWSYWAFYSPVIFYYIYKSIRHFNFLILTTTNPMIEHSGALLECKKKIDSNIDPKLRPKTIYFSLTDLCEDVFQKFEATDLSYPIIAKPNIGERGDFIRIIRSQVELKNYIQNAPRDYHLQEYIHDGFEAGVFVVKRPGEKAQITSITTKGLFKVIGDGSKTLLELVKRQPRYYFLKESIQRIYPSHPWGQILNQGEEFIVEPVANHCRGTAFLDGNHLKTELLEKFFSNLTDELDGFYYGRFDLKSTSEVEFQQAKNIKIFELNGLFGEPGHIYDPKTTLLEAWRTLLQHWSWAYEIALDNIKKGYSPSKLSDILRMFRRHFFKN